MSQSNFDSFSPWWTEASPRVAAAIDRGTVGDLVNEISAQVKHLYPGLAWELGRGQHARHNLTLSPEATSSCGGSPSAGCCRRRKLTRPGSTTPLGNPLATCSW